MGRMRSALSAAGRRGWEGLERARQGFMSWKGGMGVGWRHSGELMGDRMRFR